MKNLDRLGCPCALNQTALDTLHHLLQRAIQHKQIGIAVWVNRDTKGGLTKYGFESTKIPKATRCNGSIALSLSPEGLHDLFSHVWKMLTNI